MSETSGVAKEQEGQPSALLGEDDLLARLKAWWTKDWEHHQKWLKGDQPDLDGDRGAEEDFDMVAGRQWTEAALQVLNDEGRPASVFDRIAPMVDAVCGFEVSNRQETQYLPREMGDVGVNELLTSTAQWFLDLCDGEDEESDAFRDATIAGRGWTETRLEYETNPDGDPDLSRVDPFEIFPNWEACKPNFADAKRIWRLRRMDLSSAKALVPEAQDNELHAGWASADSKNFAVTNPDDDYDAEEGRSKPEQECVLVECQWWEREPFVRYFDRGAQQIREMGVPEFNTLVDRLGQMGPEMMMLAGLYPPESPVTQYRRVYHRAFIGTKVFRKPTIVKDDFSYKAITGKRDKTRNQFRGIVRPMKDPQRWTNKLFSQIMHILNSNAKGGIMAEHGAFEDDRKAAAEWSKANAITFVNQGALAQGRIREKPVTQLPAGQSQMLQFSLEAMPMVTGISQELLGLRETNQPGILEYQRKESGLTILATLFDSLRRYRKQRGRLLLDLIQEKLSDGRLVRIVGEDGAKYVPLLKQAVQGEYDVVVDDAPTAPNSKDKNWAIVQSMLPILMPILSQDKALAAKVIRTSPLPDSISGPIVEILTAPPPPVPPPTPDQIEAKAIARAAAIADIDKDAASAEKSRADAMATQADTMRENIKSFLAAMPLSPNLPPAPVPSGPLPGLRFNVGELTPQAFAPPPPNSNGLPPLGMVTEQPLSMPSLREAGPIF